MDPEYKRGWREGVADAKAGRHSTDNGAPTLDSAFCQGYRDGYGTAKDNLHATRPKYDL